MPHVSENCTYILLCSDGSLYTGWTNSLPERIAAHNAGKGAKYTREGGRSALCTSRSSAQRRRPCAARRPSSG